MLRPSHILLHVCLGAHDDALNRQIPTNSVYLGLKKVRLLSKFGVSYSWKDLDFVALFFSLLGVLLFVFTPVGMPRRVLAGYESFVSFLLRVTGVRGAGEEAGKKIL